MIHKFQENEKIFPEKYDTDKKRYFITNSPSLNVTGYEKIPSIDFIEECNISKYHYFLFFECDDEYLYHLDKIIKFGGTFSAHPRSEKTNYVYTNKNARQALHDTLIWKNEISHYNEIIHGNICQALEQTRTLEGAYVEIGVYKGGSALTALNYMRLANINRQSYLLDTYDGFNYETAMQSSDVYWKNSHKLWGCEETMRRIHVLLKSTNPMQSFKLVKSNICTDEFPEEIQKIAVANIDVDMYEATKYAIMKTAERLVDNGIIVAEDPASTPLLIGAYYAMEEFLNTPLGKKFIKIHVTGQYFLIKVK